ncbi:hypothetical protein [uncultured Phascolarctobacterium sp.]|uniref:hypothetical protein n=1 Tax=uncultured Phascolarctobacterium sp. TaxID=512296 RepID=UPI0026378610|nr:hypothetical protein [uncultured Phascolarctobacterium sp.]
MRKVRKICCWFLLLIMIVLLSGCGGENKSQFEGKWLRETAYNKETSEAVAGVGASFVEIGRDKDQFTLKMPEYTYIQTNAQGAELTYTWQRFDACSGKITATEKENKLIIVQNNAASHSADQEEYFTYDAQTGAVLYWSKDRKQKGLPPLSYKKFSENDLAAVKERAKKSIEGSNFIKQLKNEYSKKNIALKLNIVD